MDTDKHRYANVLNPSASEPPQPLTLLTEDEAILRDSVRQFAEARVRPLVREMDEHAKIPRSLVDHLFDLGVMGIEIPETYGGAGGTVFPPLPPLGGTSRRGPSVRRLRAGPNTLRL